MAAEWAAAMKKISEYEIRPNGDHPNLVNISNEQWFASNPHRSVNITFLMIFDCAKNPYRG